MKFSSTAFLITEKCLVFVGWFRAAMFSYSKIATYLVSNSIGIFHSMENNCCKTSYKITKVFFKKSLIVNNSEIFECKIKN